MYIYICIYIYINYKGKERQIGDRISVPLQRTTVGVSTSGRSPKTRQPCRSDRAAKQNTP